MKRHTCVTCKDGTRRCDCYFCTKGSRHLGAGNAPAFPAPALSNPPSLFRTFSRPTLPFQLSDCLTFSVSQLESIPPLNPFLAHPHPSNSKSPIPPLHTGKDPTLSASLLSSHHRAPECPPSTLNAFYLLPSTASLVRSTPGSVLSHPPPPSALLPLHRVQL